MLKKLLPLTLAVLMVAGSLAARTQRVSIIFIHYSTGTIIVDGYCWGDTWRRNITETLDTATVTYGIDTARIVFHSYRLNNDAGYSALSDTLPGSDENGCAFDRFSNFTYDLVTSHYNRMRIWNSDGGFSGKDYAGLLEHFFNVPNKEEQQFWKLFKTHNTPSSFTDSVTEENGYDLVIIKNPYACWAYMTQAQADSIRVLYEAVRDSIANHPEINIALAFGTPLRLGTQVFDSSQAKITYNLATWFASDSFFTHSNTGPYKNLWKWDSYRLYCEMSPDSVNRYCLKNAYYGDGDSHPNPQLGATTGQESLIAFIRNATSDILIQRSNDTTVTRSDIDRKIREFQRGQAAEEDVLALIRQYNSTR